MEDALRKVLGLLLATFLFLAPSLARAEVSYRASFDWAAATGVSSTATARRMEIRVIAPQNTSGVVSVDEARAEIWSTGKGARREAVCSIKNLVKDDSAVPKSLDLECRAVGFDRLTATAQISWPGELRFGTWATGFERTALRVEKDDFARPRGGRPMLAGVAAPSGN